MNSLETTARVIEILEQAGVPYMLVGAYSSNAYGIARSTNDVDFVVQLNAGDLTRICQGLGPDFRLDPQLQFETLTNTVRNVITYRPTSFDIELFRLSQDPHHQERFQRRRRTLIGGVNREAWIPTAEDVVIQKLRWQRAKDLIDVCNVIAVRRDELDWDYIRHWAREHGTTELLERLLRELPNLDSLEIDEPE